MSRSFPMNGGDGTNSYTNNSTVQRYGLSAMKDVIKESIIQNLEIEKMLLFGSSSTTFAIADLGCSVGPNTFYAAQILIEAVQHKYNQESSNGSTSKNLEFQVFFNDQIGNDFNTLFASLPEPRNYLAAAVPGSFHGRLFPSSSIHLAYSSFAIHWLSKVPEAIRVKDSPAWNAGKIHYTGASSAVVKAYEDQFEEDMEVFLRARAQEIVGGGMMVIMMLGVPRRDVQHIACKLYTFIESIFMGMVKEGVLEEELVNSFNLPIVYPYVVDMRIAVEKNKCFEIVKMETVDNMPKESPDPEVVIMTLRVILERSIINHFGDEIADQLFVRAKQQTPALFRIFDSSAGSFGGILFTVLKRKV